MTPLETLLELIQNNPDLLNQLNQLQAPAPTPTPTTILSVKCPAISTLKLAQATFYDNGVHRPKNKAEFALTFEMWTEDLSTLKLSRKQWKKSASLSHYYKFKPRIDSLLARGSISQEFYEDLVLAYEAVAPQPNQPETPWLGLVADKTPGVGTAILDGHLAYVRIQKRMPTHAEFLLNGDGIRFARFTTTDLKGNPLKGNAEAQSRVDLTGSYHPKWST